LETRASLPVPYSALNIPDLLCRSDYFVLAFHPLVKETMNFNANDAQQLRVHSGPLIAHACRLVSGSDLAMGIRSAAKLAVSNIPPSLGSNRSGALVVLSGVGSVSELCLRMADATKDGGSYKELHETLEIVSVTGTIAINSTNDDSIPLFHLHMSVSDTDGNVYGGHFVSGTVHTTMELVLGSITCVSFQRLPDEATGFRELVVRPCKHPDDET
jgi:hypothetical protein